MPPDISPIPALISSCFFFISASSSARYFSFSFQSSSDRPRYLTRKRIEKTGRPSAPFMPDRFCTSAAPSAMMARSFASTKRFSSTYERPRAERSTLFVANAGYLRQNCIHIGLTSSSLNTVLSRLMHRLNLYSSLDTVLFDVGTGFDESPSTPIMVNLSFGSCVSIMKRCQK